MAASASSSKLEIRRIADQLHRAIHGDAWHGPSWKEIAKEIDTPSTRAAWLDIARQRLTGPVAVTGEIDFPPVAALTWPGIQRRLWNAARAPEREILQLDDAQLDLPLPGKPSRTIYVELHGAIQHAIYHTGQVMLLHRTASA